MISWREILVSASQTRLTLDLGGKTLQRVWRVHRPALASHRQARAGRANEHFRNQESIHTCHTEKHQHSHHTNSALFVLAPTTVPTGAAPSAPPPSVVFFSHLLARACWRMCVRACAAQGITKRGSQSGGMVGMAHHAWAQTQARSCMRARGAII